MIFETAMFFRFYHLGFSINIETANYRIKFKSVTAKLNEPVDLTCESFGELPIATLWFKEKIPFMMDNQR